MVKPEVDENLQAEYLQYVMSGVQTADLLMKLRSVTE